MANWKFDEIKIQDCKEFVLYAGRVIGCKGSDYYFSISSDEGASYIEIDAMAHYVVDMLNKRKDFKKFYEEYMRG